jgi:hypothetical protein
MSAQATWKPHTEHGDLTTRSNLPEACSPFAPAQSRSPMQVCEERARRFDQVEVCPTPIATLPSPTSRRLRRVRCGGEREQLARARVSPLGDANSRGSRFPRGQQ